MPIKPDCLFCGEEPCVTHADKEKPKRSRKPSGFAVSASTPTSIPSSEEPISTGWEPTATKRIGFEKRVVEKVFLDEEELLLREALRNLWDILGPSSKAEYKHLVDPARDGADMKRQTDIRRMIHGND